jgi:hypothetical protein
MRLLRCHQMSGVTVQEVLDDFNERAKGFGITDETDILTVSAMPLTHSIPRAGSDKPKVEVVIIYWSEK